MRGNAATVGVAAGCGGGGRSSHGVAGAEKTVASSARAQIKGHIHLCVVFRLFRDTKPSLPVLADRATKLGVARPTDHYGSDCHRSQAQLTCGVRPPRSHGVALYESQRHPPLGVGPSCLKRRWRTANGLGRGVPQPSTYSRRCAEQWLGRSSLPGEGRPCFAGRRLCARALPAPHPELLRPPARPL
jgi:hypothetical protein